MKVKEGVKQDFITEYCKQALSDFTLDMEESGRRNENETNQTPKGTLTLTPLEEIICLQFEKTTQCYHDCVYRMQCVALEEIKKDLILHRNKMVHNT